MSNLGKDLLNILSEGGHLSKNIKGFQERKEQQALTEKILEAFSTKKIALLEAGTGVGKTYSYLLPALFIAHIQQKKIAISTYTIQLQEQLIKKDLPNLLKILGFDLEINLILGMGNYACIKRMEEEKCKLPDELVIWGEKTNEGKKSSINFFVAKETWEEIQVDKDSCIGVRCKHFKDCFFFKDREKAKNSQVLIFNHHLLVHDLLTKEEKERTYLPDYELIVVDEAHHFEEVVRSVLAKKASYIDLVKLLNRLFLEGKSEGGRLNQLQNTVELHDPSNTALTAFKQKFLFDLPALKRETVKYGKDFFDAIHFLMHGDGKRIVDQSLKEHPLWQEVTERGKELLVAIKRFATFIVLVDQEIKNTRDEKLIEKTFSLRHEISSYGQRLHRYHETLDDVLFGKEDVNSVTWLSLERERTSAFHAAKLDVAPALQELLFKENKSIIFLSATLATGSSFSFMKERLGISKEPIEGIFDSPFNWKKQALFLTASDLPDPDSSDFFFKAKEVILDAVQATFGHTLILFTSYGSLEQFHNGLKNELATLRYTAIKQGEKGKHEIIDLFKSSKSPVLFGTDSFWEGIDIVGDMLRQVIIVKLPFKVPDEPLVQALSIKLKSEKKDPFFSYFLPQAVVKFKQGFGRLIRHQDDKGIVLCLDKRIISKGYGKRFLSAIPDCQKEVILAKDVGVVIKNFFKRIPNV